MEHEDHRRKQDGLLTAVFTTYRGLATIALAFVAGMFFDAKFGEILKLPTTQQQTAAELRHLQFVHDSLLNDLADVRAFQAANRELLLDVVCNSPETSNRRECRFREVR